ncbi:Transmembrane protein 65 [Papilio machaon]|uniref:Transmembrane protein 65 n=1 Tax=Papilio machaon TaxID=76193 RepID=A0A0N1PGM3_PAPMA|nr:Transmembrane protein 65 [Papilio machaon]
MKAIHAMKRFCGTSMFYFNTCCHQRLSKLQVRHSVTVGTLKLKKIVPDLVNIRNLGLGPTSKDFEEPTQISGPLTKVHATELVLHLNDEERKVLFNALQEYESNRIKEEFEDKLAGQRWRSKLGRPSKVPTLGDVDPTGTYCPVPEDWLKKKYAATVPKPTTKELLHLSLANSIPFIGFGFLDNFIMIIAGDSIESSMSAYITLSTMAAAALGNTFSDVIGIGSSYYVERGAALIGLGAPALSPVQLDMPVSRRFANMGRVLGITLGCFLGMTPLLFKDDEKKTDAKDK